MSKHHWSKDGLGKGSVDSRTFFEKNGCTVFKSYATIIGFTDRDGNSYITNESFSSTTSKHQAHLGRLLGCIRIDHEEFKKLYNKLVIEPETDGKDHSPMFG